MKTLTLEEKLFNADVMTLDLSLIHIQMCIRDSPGAQQLGFNRAELSIGFFEAEDYLKYVQEVYPQIVE